MGMKWLAYAKSNNEYLVFGYRTLKESAVREEIWGIDPGTEPYELDGYKKVNVVDGFDNLEKSKDSNVKGILLRLSKEQLDALDDWEERYHRSRVGEMENKPIYAYLYNNSTA